MTQRRADGDPAARMRPSVFLERQSYRRRRLMDAARILPLLGAVLFALPLLWPSVSDGAAQDAGVTMSAAIVYVFSVWAALILAVLIFGRMTRAWSRPGDARR
ncbi:hypothetical protein AB9K34_19140 [Sedimentitalea sp. XS_ASV28]|uniref:hypothetical protein n=1 Tax=Sedimentitalea sp. XS_ASV28 TaxID=3241296 RepID=UPI00351520E8